MEVTFRTPRRKIAMHVFETNAGFIIKVTAPQNTTRFIINKVGNNAYSAAMKVYYHISNLKNT